MDHDASDATILPRPGRYRHYKGNEYEVIGIARHSETEEELVVYRKLYGDRSLWVRPRDMFMESVMIDGQFKERFEWLGEKRQEIAEGISKEPR